MSKNEKLYQKAMDAITALYSDDSVDPETTKQNLQGLQDEIDVLVESLGDD